MRLFGHVLVMLLAVSTWATPLSAMTDQENAAFLSGAVNAAREGRWDLAERYAGHVTDQVGHDVVLWLRLRDGRGTWPEYLEFLRWHADWPGLELLRTRGEAQVPLGHTPDEVIGFFAPQPPRSGLGAIRLIEAFEAKGMRKQAQAETVRAWRELSLTADEETIFLDRWGRLLEPHHFVRADALLWRGLTEQAERIAPKLSEGQAALVAARIALRRQAAGVDTLIARVPGDLAEDAGLAYERFLWRVKKGRMADAQALLVERSTSVAALGDPAEWAYRRRLFAREAMIAGEWQRAYDLAARHFLDVGSAYAELEWLSGYIALKGLNKPDLALFHFSNHRDQVATPISLGRAGYWIGRAHEAMGQAERADESYRAGALHQTSFYGQLAAEKAGIALDPALAGQFSAPDWRTADFAGKTLLKAALLLHYADEQLLSRWFFVHLASTLDETGQQQLADLAMELSRPYIALMISKEAAGVGRVMPRTYFPLTELAALDVAVPAELSLSIARRESEFNIAVESGAGARGLMQLMPRTAQAMSRELNLEYSRDRLVQDWKYNATLGSHYLAKMLDRYGGSYVLAIAAYNAGPGRVDRWIGDFGDPRDPGIDVIDWIERIPFEETQNYVMRVTESVTVYRARLEGAVGPVRLTEDLRRGSFGGR